MLVLRGHFRSLENHFAKEFIMQMPHPIDPRLLAPCGMNCLICYKHRGVPAQKACTGCLVSDNKKPAHCRSCRIRSCIAQKELRICSSCPSFPCKWLKTKDKTYQTHYGISLIANGRAAASLGLEAFLLEEEKRWICPQCGGSFSLHDGVCSDCHLPLKPSSL